MSDILIRGYKAKEQIEDIIKQARYAANNCMIGSGLEIIELPEHGDLICRKRLLEEDIDIFVEYDDFEDVSGCSKDAILNAPVIVPASEEENANG